LSSLEEIRIVNDLHKELSVPVAIHIMDDWPSTISDGYFPKLIWRRVIDKEFHDLLSRSKALFSISEAMSEEYLRRYGLKFLPFHNPIVIKKWLPFSKYQWEILGEFKILYSGRIGKANGKSIVYMAHIIDELNSKAKRIILDIYTPDYNTKKAFSINNLRGVNIKNTVQHKEMPYLLASYDLLFLPLDFDRKGICFAQFSMPTKVSEYMISGTPVLVFADRRTALANYAIKGRWAYVVTDNNKRVLMKAISELYNNLALRKELGERAKAMAIQNEDANIIREKFRKSLILS
jgi:glycosyltransferase involved in cell wall biosynthesis